MGRKYASSRNFPIMNLILSGVSFGKNPVTSSNTCFEIHRTPRGRALTDRTMALNHSRPTLREKKGGRKEEERSKKGARKERENDVWVLAIVHSTKYTAHTV